MTRTIQLYLENGALLAVGFMAGSWFQRNPVGGMTGLYYGIAAIAIISARVAVVSYRNRADRAMASGL
jgi:uncharacterized membrane protein